MLEMKNKFENEDFWYEGGHGKSIKDPVIIRGTQNPVLGVFAEKHFISSRFGEEGSDWFFDSQELFLVDSEAFGFRPFRCRLSLTQNLPNPLISTSSPDSRVLFVISRRVSTISEEWFLGNPI